MRIPFSIRRTGKALLRYIIRTSVCVPPPCLHEAPARKSPFRTPRKKKRYGTVLRRPPRFRQGSGAEADSSPCRAPRRRTAASFSRKGQKGRTPSASAQDSPGVKKGPLRSGKGLFRFFFQLTAPVSGTAEAGDAWDARKSLPGSPVPESVPCP